MKEKLLIIFLLFILAQSICKNKDQKDGSCTQCEPGNVLVKGFCVQRMRGCLTHTVNALCLECQFGYVLSVGACIRQAIFYGNTDLSPAPIVPSSVKFLTFEEIENKLGKMYGPYFSNIHEFFLNKYEELGKGQIKKVDSVQTKQGVILRIQYSQNGQIYIAEAFMDIFNNIKQISFQKGEQLNGIVKLVQKIKKQKAEVKNLFVFEVIIQPNEFIIDFMDAKNDVIRFTALRFGNDKLDYKTFNISFINLAKEKVLNQYPELQQKQLFSMQNSGFTIFMASDQTVSISLIFQNYRFLINHPVKNFVSDGSFVSGAFQQFTQYQDPRYLSAIDYMLKEFPELTNSQIVQVRSEVVSGINFLFSLLGEQKTDRYILKIFHDFRGVNQLIEGYKNGGIIYKLEHDYNKDKSFLANYLSAIEKSKVLNYPPIASVSKKVEGSIFYYKVNYNFEEFMEFQVNLVNNQVKLKGYKIGGQNLNQLLSSFSEKSTRRSPNVLINFFKAQNPIVIGQKIKQITYSEPYYTLIFTVSTGTYKAVIEDKGELSVISYDKLDNSTCFDLSSAQIQSDDVVGAVDKFLKTHYPIENYSIQSIQVKVLEGRFEYKYLYANQRLKQTEFYLEERDSQIIVKKASILDFGYEIVDKAADSELYKQFTESLASLDLGYQQPLYVDKNGTYLRSYFSQGKQTIEAFFDADSMEIKLSKTIDIQKYLLLPEGFTFDGLKIPSVKGEQATSIQTKQIQNLVKAAEAKYKSFIANPQVKYAQKIDERTYLIMVKAQKGYIKFQGAIVLDEEQTISYFIKKTVITNYEDSDFSSCQKFSNNGQCLLCPKGYFSYLGSCFSQMQGCLVQLGALCAKCDTNFVKSHYRCYRQCQLFFD